jgi:hypothetical protein
MNEAKTVPAMYSEAEQELAELEAYFAQQRKHTREMPAVQLEGLRAACIEVDDRSVTP